MAYGVVHWEIGGTNTAKTREFYSKLFGWEFQSFEGLDYGMVQPVGEGSIGGGIGPVPPGGSPYVTFYVHVDDLARSLEKAASLGGKTVLPPTPIPGVGSCAMFADLNGDIIGLFKPDVQ
ncbi:MAG: VOC family protein [candidate division Zixibacteria bacterium]|nr:VOC family protein [candidate division Zixibacteria bacterium]